MGLTENACRVSHRSSPTRDLVEDIVPPQPRRDSLRRCRSSCWSCRSCCRSLGRTGSRGGSSLFRERGRLGTDRLCCRCRSGCSSCCCCCCGCDGGGLTGGGDRTTEAFDKAPSATESETWRRRVRISAYLRKNTISRRATDLRGKWNRFRSRVRLPSLDSAGPSFPLRRS